MTSTSRTARCELAGRVVWQGRNLAMTAPDAAWTIGMVAPKSLTSTPTLAFGHRLRGKEGDSYGAMQEKPLA